MTLLYNILFGFGMLVAILFSALVLITGKGDAMSGGGAVRTTFKGKASFDDFMSRWTLILGISWMAVMLVLDVIVSHVAKK